MNDHDELRRDPDVWFPYAQRPTAAFEILVRAGTSELTAANAVQQTVAELDPSVPLVRAQPLADVPEEQPIESSIEQ